MNVILPVDASVVDLMFVVSCVFALFIGFISGLLVK